MVLSRPKDKFTRYRFRTRAVWMCGVWCVLERCSRLHPRSNAPLLPRAGWMSAMELKALQRSSKG